MPAGRRILPILQATSGADVHKVDEETDNFVIFQEKKKRMKIFPTWNFRRAIYSILL